MRKILRFQNGRLTPSLVVARDAVDDLDSQATKVLDHLV